MMPQRIRTPPNPSEPRGPGSEKRPPARFFPTRARGQNFLRDPVLAERFAAAALAPPALAPALPAAPGAGEPDPVVVEIGAGKGAITLPLLRAGAPVRVRVVAVESDDRLAALLEARARKEGIEERLRVVRADARSLDFRSALAGFGAVPPAPICGNLPFSVASVLLVRLIEAMGDGATPLFTTLTVSLQREVAARASARTGDAEYGALSVVVRRALEPRVLFNIPPRAFRPRPRVVTSVVRFTPRPDPPPVGDARQFNRLVRALFTHRRKVLSGGIARIPDPDLARRAAAAAAALGIDTTLRAEQLRVEDFAALALRVGST